MADPYGFLKHARAEGAKRPVAERIADWGEVSAELPREERDQQVRTQATRCMDCGIPFCHSGSAGCPLGNLIPEWNDLVRRGQWEAASERLHATNNFPEFTGRLCPAPCESACVLAISPLAGGAVTIKRVEQTIADTAWEEGTVRPRAAAVSSGRRVAVVGSGPAGLAAAQQLTRAGHDVTVFERDDRLGGLLRYGIPEFKLEKSVLDRRLAQMRAEGTRFVTNCEVGVDLTVEELRAGFDAVVLAVGALRGRDDRVVPGRELTGVHLAMEHLVPANRFCEGDGEPAISAAGKHVVIIGGGDTAADCLGTAHRQGAASVVQLDQYPEPPHVRDDAVSPWPVWPLVLRSYPAHDEGGERKFAVAVERFVGDDAGHVRAVHLRKVRVEKDAEGRRQVIPVSDEVEELPCDLALLAIGFEGVEPMALLDGLDIQLSRRGTISCGADWQTTAPGVFVCGDAHRGASLVVWAIAEGRSVAHAVDSFLTGSSDLPAPVHPTALPLSVR
ncbi:glutamate synthase (NADPH/NADH) small chain [Streptoalloteichus tenebrarius]|uniref:Glutamate synthase (NADPH/NADH) small chain n=1 Tax=Streptoalloteichus tenebrarius (strain ATCC 17920 / DSM 40477 / JCM 4838 / CBS 697.72 / NBRC 16177 / NCIMB 11028 / NRRL B-12390 / A12253. 1 / ISP 5477) TaxID=1933 RepID=A0ABT1HNF9_STRSD|nr:glutamate synthase subunit beta [Streptoalloteichus tenebrarius]MCP2257040.1 glutamate synthase (NADPH/NADH) small chain [Streptoalloteichus tenebrarius]BFF00050.1 glutamate synthase subunit beta [Streptoalloteichus tenebrarius]